MSDPDLMETLKVDIAELKNMVTTAQADVDAYKAEKKFLSPQDKLVKEKSIQEQRKAIDLKRQNILKRIEEVKKSWAQMNIEEIEDQSMRSNLYLQKEQELSAVSGYETELKSLQTPPLTILDKVQQKAG